MPYLTRRVGQSLVVIWLVSVIVFVLLHALPGGPARAILGKAATPAQVKTFQHAQGLDRSLIWQYTRWAGNALRGDFGYSYQQNQSVGSLIAERLPKTVLLAGMSVLVAVVVAIVIGTVQAARRNSGLDHTLTGITFLGYATPGFFLAIVFVYLFAVHWRVFPAQAPQATGLVDILRQANALILPVAIYSIGIVAAFSRYVRSSVIDNLFEDYVRTAWAKGAPPRRVYLRHILRNAIGPVVTLLGLYLPVILSGGVIIESVFNYPGMGLLFWNAAQSRDYPVLLGVTLLVGTATVAGSLMADLGYAAINPRVRAKR